MGVEGRGLVRNKVIILKAVAGEGSERATNVRRWTKNEEITGVRVWWRRRSNRASCLGTREWRKEALVFDSRMIDDRDDLTTIANNVSASTKEEMSAEFIDGELDVASAEINSKLTDDKPSRFSSKKEYRERGGFSFLWKWDKKSMGNEFRLSERRWRRKLSIK